jgi:phosphoserine phosphatase RsbU/P
MNQAPGHLEAYPDGDAGKVLVVHGSESVRESLCQRLREAGHEVIAAQTGEEALAALIGTDNSADLVIADLRAPGLDAPGLITRMKAVPVLAATPVIILAQSADADGVERCLTLGAEDYLLAPFSPTLLKAQVRDYLRIGAQRRQELRRAEREDLLKIDRDVQIARQIQVGFLPRELPQPVGWEIAARFYPARQVAGDFYDAFMLTQGRRVGLVIADVCDKGVGAALFMALVRSLIRAYAMQHYSLRWTDLLDDKLTSGAARSRAAPSTGTSALKNAMNLTNDYIAHNHADSNMFATTFFGVLDPISGILTYVNGGHNPPVIVGPQGIKSRLKPTGPAVGMLPDVDYRIAQATIEPGDILFTYTDGVTDTRAPNPGRELFSEKRMLALVEQPALTAVALLDRLDSALHTHMADADQFDDITMLAARRIG